MGLGKVAAASRHNRPSAKRTYLCTILRGDSFYFYPDFTDEIEQPRIINAHYCIPCITYGPGGIFWVEGLVLRPTGQRGQFFCVGYFWSEIQQRTLDRGDDVEKSIIKGTSIKTITQKNIATRSLLYNRHPCQFSGSKPKHTRFPAEMHGPPKCTLSPPPNHQL
jgi:hypothetical protein